MQKKNEKRVLLSNTIAFGVGTLGAKVIMFFLLPVYTTYMTTAELGVAELIVSTVSLLLPLASLSITSALLRLALEKDKDKKQVFAISVLVTVLGVLIVSLIIYFIPLGKSSLNEWKGYLCLLLLADSLRRNFSVFSKALDKITIFSLDNIFYTIILFVANLFLLINLHRGTAGYIEAAIIADFCSIIFLTFGGKLYEYFEWRRIDVRLLRQMVLFSIPLIVNAMSWWITNSSDRYVLEFLMGEDAVGIYSVANKIPLLLTTFFSVFLQAWSLSSITAYENNEDKGFYESIWQLYSCLAFLGSALLIAVTKVIMGPLVGDAFSDAWIYVPLLIVGGAANQVSGFFSSIYIALKKNVSVMLITLAGALINIVLNIILIPYMGIQGAALATALTCIAVWIYYMIGTQKYVKINLKMGRLLASGTILTIEIVAVIQQRAAILVSVICIVLQVVMYRKTIITLYDKMRSELQRVMNRGREGKS